MTDNIKALDFNGVKVKRDVNTVFLRLADLVSGAGNRTFHNTADNSNYQVPIGKKTTLIFIEAWNDGGAANRIISTTVVDSITGAVTLFQPNVTTLLTDIIFISAEVAASLFIGVEAPGGWTVLPIVFAIEENV